MKDHQKKRRKHEEQGKNLCEVWYVLKEIFNKSLLTGTGPVQWSFLCFYLQPEPPQVPGQALIQDDK